MGNAIKSNRENSSKSNIFDSALSESVFDACENNNTSDRCSEVIQTVMVNDTSTEPCEVLLNNSNSNAKDFTESDPDKMALNNRQEPVVEEPVTCVNADVLDSACLTQKQLKLDLNGPPILLNRDSAYGSSSESGCNAQNEQVNPEVSAGKNEKTNAVNTSNHVATKTSSPNILIDSTTLANKWSSSSSIASDSASEIHTYNDDTEVGMSFGVSREHNFFNNLSSSTFSLRSSLSLESEDDFTSGDDSTQRPKLGKCDGQVKAQRGWKKIRQMVAWSPFIQSFKKKYPWVQLAGHAGNFQPGEEGCILKKYVEREAECLKGLSTDVNLQPFAPTFHGIVYLSDEKYTRMQDLLLPFDNPSLMDCKMGIRTYLENELIQAREKPRLRQDMYQKMVEISPNEPTEEERHLKAVTKPRYMQWREQVSSTSNLGFRIEGIKKSSKVPSKDYKLTKTAEQVAEAFKYFIAGDVVVLEKYIERLKTLRDTLETSDFFHRHETIGSSLLFVHDESSLANVWMIDFGKTSRLPASLRVDHRSEWKEGNREDGYLFGVDNMIQLFENILNGLNAADREKPAKSPPSPCAPKVDIIVTAPSPTVMRKMTLRRQEAGESETHGSES